jgi:hypothetical protein
MLLTEITIPRDWMLVENKAGKNVHMTHLEDLVLDDGHTGAREALAYLEGVRGMLDQGGDRSQQVTVKWDGAPAIVCGTDPETGKFFVGTKSVFGKTPKLGRTHEEIDSVYGESPVKDKLHLCLDELSKLGIKGIVQGDMMFTKDSVKEEKIDGDEYLTFRPNTITYAVRTGTEMAKRISAANLGIVFHTAYEGNSIADASASFGVDVSGYNKTSSVWVDDAFYKDVTGSATLSDKQNNIISRGIIQIRNTLDSTDTDKFDAVTQQPDFKKFVQPYINNLVRQERSVGDSNTFIKGFQQFFQGKMQGEISKLKGGPDSPAAQNRLQKIQDLENSFVENKDVLFSVLTVYKQINNLKLMLIKKLNTVEGMNTFVKTDKGYEVTNPEGYVAVGKSGGAVKFNDRLEFNRNNFVIKKEW